MRRRQMRQGQMTREQITREQIKPEQLTPRRVDERSLSAPRQVLYLFVCSVIALSSLSCFDEVTSEPPCFLEVNDHKRESTVVETGVCCDPQSDGDQACVTLFTDLGYDKASRLAFCTERERCRLCEIGVTCSCLNDRDCSEDTVCQVIDDREQCESELDMPEMGRRCAICVPRDSSANMSVEPSE